MALLSRRAAVRYGRGGMAVVSVDATAYLEALPHRRVRRPVRLRQTADTYPLEPAPEQSWLPVAFRAFAELARRTAVEDLLIVGTGIGLDALGALETFDRLRTLTATDLHPAGVEVARKNVVAHVLPGGPALAFLASDLLSCVPPGQRFSLVYENLPNLPAAPAADLRRGTIGGRFFDAAGLDVPEPFGAYRLALHHRLLTEARERVRPGGGVLTAIGGRMSHDVAFELHRTCGYEPQLVAFDVKVQVEPELVVPPYRDAEAEHGLPFRFYAPEAIGLVAAARGDGLDGEALAAAVEAELDRLALSAREAAARVARGGPVGHSVLMIFGAREPVSPPARRS
jgi:methylase of polypeptide subunit release factors